MSSLVYFLPIFGLVGLVYMFFLQKWVTKQDAGDDKMQGIAKHIADGAMAFLKAEYRIAVKSGDDDKADVIFDLAANQIDY